MNPCRVVVAEKDTVVIENFDIPPVGINQVLVETLYSAISPGTELAGIQNAPNTLGQYPYYPGYSACGRVVAKGEAVETLSIGQTVACQIPHASHWVTNADSCHAIPNGITEVEASVYRLASVALQGVRKAQIQIGWDVAVVGLGPIGNLAGQITRVAGATFVAAIDRNKWRCGIAMQCGIDIAAGSLESEMPAGGFDAVIEATGNPDTITTSFRLAKRMGRVVLLGSHRGVTERVNFYSNVHKKGLIVVGAHDSIRPSTDDCGWYCSLRTDVQTVFKLIASGRINISPLISDTVPFKETRSAYERLAERETHLMTIAISWT